MMKVQATPNVEYSWPADVLTYARDQGVEAYLAPLLEATWSIFPTADRIDVCFEPDWDIPNEAYIVFRVGLAGWDLERVAQARRAWNEAFFRVYPPPFAVCPFILGLELVD